MIRVRLFRSKPDIAASGMADCQRNSTIKRRQLRRTVRGGNQPTAPSAKQESGAKTACLRGIAQGDRHRRVIDIDKAAKPPFPDPPLPDHEHSRCAIPKVVGRLRAEPDVLAFCPPQYRPSKRSRFWLIQALLWAISRQFGYGAKRLFNHVISGRTGRCGQGGDKTKSG